VLGVLRTARAGCEGERAVITLGLDRYGGAHLSHNSRALSRPGAVAVDDGSHVRYITESQFHYHNVNLHESRVCIDKDRYGGAHLSHNSRALSRPGAVAVDLMDLMCGTSRSLSFITITSD
jgi:hypothetical protein